MVIFTKNVFVLKLSFFSSKIQVLHNVFDVRLNYKRQNYFIVIRIRILKEKVKVTWLPYKLEELTYYLSLKII